MKIEYEATFPNINKDEIRERLKKIGAVLVRPEFLQKRTNFHLPKERKNNYSWIRVRDEGDKITLSLKVVDGDKIGNQKELCLQVDNFINATEFLKNIGCEKKASQETKRELWTLDGAEITIDEWPFLEPFVEIEGSSEEEVKIISKKLGFNYGEAVFGGADEIYNKKYGIDKDIINNIPEVTFTGKNPFKISNK